MRWRAVVVGFVLGAASLPGSWEAARADRVVPTARVQHHVPVRAEPRSESVEIGALEPGQSLSFVRDVPWNQGGPLGEELSCGDASVFILTANTGNSSNSQSLVLAIAYGEFGVTLTGDAEGSTERLAHDNFKGAVKTTVLSGSHHGARTHSSNSALWADSTFPKVVIFSAGRRFGHPQCVAVDRYKGSVASVPAHPTQCGDGNRYEPARSPRDAIYMTELNGRIVVTSGGESPLSIFCSRSPECESEIPH